jgi:hypothetical protein
MVEFQHQRGRLTTRFSKTRIGLLPLPLCGLIRSVESSLPIPWKRRPLEPMSALRSAAAEEVRTRDGQSEPRVSWGGVPLSVVGVLVGQPRRRFRLPPSRRGRSAPDAAPPPMRRRPRRPVGLLIGGRPRIGRAPARNSPPAFTAKLSTLNELSVSTAQQAVQKAYPAKRFRFLPRWTRGGEPVKPKN